MKEIAADVLVEDDKRAKDLQKHASTTKEVLKPKEASAGKDTRAKETMDEDVSDENGKTFKEWWKLERSVGRRKQGFWCIVDAMRILQGRIGSWEKNEQDKWDRTEIVTLKETTGRKRSTQKWEKQNGKEKNLNQTFLYSRIKT